MNQYKKLFHYKMTHRIMAILLLVLFLCSIVLPVYAETNVEAKTENNVESYDKWHMNQVIEDVSKVLLTQTPTAKPGSIGGEWVIIGLARSDIQISNQYKETYYHELETLLKEKQGKLHSRKYTEYSRTILALNAIGKDASNVAGYNLYLPLNDYATTVKQGLNGAIFALLALDSNNTGKNQNIKNQNNKNTEDLRKQYMEFILSKELSTGGWAISGMNIDIDLTAMAIQALAPYRDNEKVNKVIDRGLTQLSLLQNNQGGYTAYGVDSCEATAQVMIMLATLGIDWNDERFVKQGNTTVDRLMQFYQKEKGFTHILGGEINRMATEQAFCALVAMERTYKDKNTFYDMTAEPALIVEETEPQQMGLLQNVIKKVNVFFSK